MKFTKWILCLFLSIPALTSFSQVYTIQGCLLDESGNRMTVADVFLWNASDS